jgi:hypothetical protein
VFFDGEIVTDLTSQRFLSLNPGYEISGDKFLKIGGSDKHCNFNVDFSVKNEHSW